MLFSSMTFIFVFLPFVCLLYFLSNKFLSNQKIQNYILLIASLLFYAWGEPHYLLTMLFIIVINYSGAILIEHYKNNKKLLLFFIISINLVCLFYFKYFNFFIENINNIFNTYLFLPNIIMPIGISFYTFQAISYIIDVYLENTKAQKDFFKLSLYITLFPQLVAGPIVKYHDISEQISNRVVNFDKIVYGVKRFIIGLAKKVLIANTLGSVADKIFSQPVEAFNPLISWIGAISYSFQLFYDFSGYSDMAIGLGSIFGFKFLENFNYPYISKSITEFWRRWHISLSSWFKQYLYIPLGGNRKGTVRTYVNLFIVFLATGFWHGASWSFVIWGLWHGFFMIIERIFDWNKSKDNKKDNNITNFLRHTYTILIFVIGWVMFRSDNLTYAFDYIKNMFGLIKNHQIIYTTLYYVDYLEIITLICATICSFPIFKNILSIKNKTVNIILNIWLLLLFVISVSFIASSTYNPFIYFRF